MIDVKTASLIEIFNYVENHLLTQNRKSKSFELHDEDESGYCMYRGPDGTSCAVGGLIPDEKYSKQLEYKSLRHPDVIKSLFDINDVRFFYTHLEFINEYKDEKYLILDIYKKLKLLSKLQYIHDRFPSVSWVEHLTNLRNEVENGTF